MEIYVKDNKALSLDNKFITPAPTSEVWVLNEAIPIPEQLLTGEVESITLDAPEFSWGPSGRNTATYIYMEFQDSALAYVIWYEGESVENAYPKDPTWYLGDIYRTLTFTSPPTGDLLTWLQENGTKQ